MKYFTKELIKSAEAFLCDEYSGAALREELLNIGIIGKIGKKPSGGGFFSKL